MLGMQQPSLLLSSPSSRGEAKKSGLGGIGGVGMGPSSAMTNSPLLCSSGIDEKSLKDMMDILNKRIEVTRNLNEFSQILQVENISE
jgi:hypothetical protein